LIQTCDIISFHAPSTPETFHILNKNNLNLVKKGAILINTSRGNLIDNDAIILGVEKSIFSAVALDVLDKEPPFFNRNYKSSLYVNHDVAILESYPNVIITPHIAFYTDQAVKDMVDNTIKGVLNFYEKH
jgi:D-lactate dehydrogenase